jgi:hypothetical protein
MLQKLTCPKLKKKKKKKNFWPAKRASWPPKRQREREREKKKKGVPLPFHPALPCQSQK